MSKIQLCLVSILLLIAAGCTPKNMQPQGDKTPSYEAYSQLGMEYLRLGDTVNAKTTFKRALEANDRYPEAYNGLALAFQLEEDNELAEQYFRKATSYAPESAMIHNNFGAFLFSQKRFVEACQMLTRATEDPFYNLRSQAFENLGRCYLRIDRPDVALHAFSRSLKIAPNRPVALVEVADLLIGQGDYYAAEASYGRFLKLVEAKKVEHFAKSLWVGIRLARYNRQATKAATYALILKNSYPDSAEYQKYKESAR